MNFRSVFLLGNKLDLAARRQIDVEEVINLSF
jgi:hypothetical protein